MQAFIPISFLPHPQSVKSIQHNTLLKVVFEKDKHAFFIKRDLPLIIITKQLSNFKFL